MTAWILMFVLYTGRNPSQVQIIDAPSQAACEQLATQLRQYATSTRFLVVEHAVCFKRDVSP